MFHLQIPCMVHSWTDLWSEGWKSCFKQQRAGHGSEPLTCLHLLRPPIRVPPVLPPLCFSVALTFTIEQSPLLLINSERFLYPNMVPYPSCLSHITCQEIGLVAFMFFFELLIFLCFFTISFYLFLTNLFSITPFLICWLPETLKMKEKQDSIQLNTGNSLKYHFTT